jgi:hypothetical protein
MKIVKFGALQWKEKDILNIGVVNQRTSNPQYFMEPINGRRLHTEIVHV